MRITNVNTMPGYKVQVAFDDGVSGVINLKEFVAKGIFSDLRDEQLFNKVYTNGYSIAWSDELEIDALTVYAEILGKKPEEILSRTFSHAAN